jgi:hypothetical protein
VSWMCSGDVDGVVPTTGTRIWLAKLNLPIETAWYPWNHSSQVCTLAHTKNFCLRELVYHTFDRLVLTGVSPPLLYLPYLEPSLLLILFIKSSIVQIKIFKSCEVTSSCIKLYPTPLTFQIHSDCRSSEFRVKLGLH